MIAGSNSGNAFSTPPGLTTRIDYLLFIFMQRDAGSNGQDIGLGPGFVLVIEANCTVRAKIISVSRLRGIAAFDAVHSAARYHFSLAVDDQIDFFCCRVVVRPVRTSRSKIHPE